MTHPARRHIHQADGLAARASDAIAAAGGSWPFVWLHAGWFGAWLAFHGDINLLTLIVSLEAIFLATFVLMTQNRQAARDRVRDDTEAQEVELLLDLNRQQLEILQLLHTWQASQVNQSEQKTQKPPRKTGG